ncbi:hypothetical protein E6C27_scaffold542G00500 [Cucumis melo var. makuwa]|uniref:Uncharacterized protein n=1 Tax=Cucumis melo var. makuwa TaxID=1194695 RepID=A0A5A7V2R9_CUCMM|nr:hypothetical protein E6C27_scaffold542G00500 [Cucumis melo var. makuwa]
MWLDDDQLACETWHRQGDFGVSETNEIEVLTKYKATETQGVDHLEVVAEEFNKEIERMSHLEPRLKPEEQGLVNAAQLKKDKKKAGTSRPNDV